jgi:hypothetical protein
VMKRAFLAAAALAVAAAAPAGAKLSTKAYFRIDVNATQHVTWSEHSSVRSCDGSVVELDGKGTGDVIARDHNEPWAVARRQGARATLLVHDEGAALAAEGRVMRNGQVGASSSASGKSPNCGQSQPPQSDCGTMSIPGGAMLYVGLITPASWTYSGPKPKVPMLTLSGPNVPEWAGMPFKFCPGASGDSILAGTWYEPPPAPPMAAPLPLSKLFGKAKHFTVSFHDERLVQTGRPGGAVLSDDHPVTTVIRWRVRFTREGPQLVADV